MLNFLVLAVAVVIGFLGFFLLGQEKISKKATAIMLLVAIALVVFSASFKLIPTGYTGVRTTFGQVDDVVLKNGFNFKIPFVQSISKVNNKQQDKTYKGEIYGEASDKTVVMATDIIVTYQINPEKSAYIYANVSNYDSELISQSLLNSAVKTAMNQLNADDVTKRGKIEPIAKTALQNAIVEKYGTDAVFIKKVTIDNMDFEESYNKAIADKQIARQNAEKQAIENQKAVDLAKANREKAEIEAETSKVKAQGEADAMIITAEAEAESYRIQSSEITENLIRKWEMEARNKHGWVTIQGANTVVTK